MPKSIVENPEARRLAAKDFVARVDVHRAVGRLGRHGVLPSDLAILLHPERLYEIHDLALPSDPQWQVDTERGVLFYSVRVVADPRLHPSEYRVVVDFAALDERRVFH